MKCIKCGYESPVQFSQCPVCRTVQSFQPAVGTSAAPVPADFGKWKGETAAVITAVVVSVLSVIAALVIFVAFVLSTASKESGNGDFGIDAFDDEDANGFGDIEDFFKDYYSAESKYNSESPAGLNTPIQFKETLYSFSEGETDTEYEVSMTATYCGEAALKLLEGATLPEYNKDTDNIFVARFDVKITKQEKEALVTIPNASPAAYPSNKTSFFSSGYTFIGLLPYTNMKKLVKTGEVTETWLAFIADKEDKTPCVRWKATEDKVFRSTEDAVSDPSLVEAGAAIDQTFLTESNPLSEETSSDNGSSD